MVVILKALPRTGKLGDDVVAAMQALGQADCARRNNMPHYS